MASAQLAEEELQQSVVVSEEDMDGDEGSPAHSHANAHGQPSASDLEIAHGPSSPQPPDLEAEHDSEHTASQDAMRQDQPTSFDDLEEHDDPEEEDAEGDLDEINTEEEANSRDVAPGFAGDHSAAGWSHGRTSSRSSSNTGGSGSLPSLEDAEDEGVGAVKIKPGETEDEEDTEDSEADESSHTEISNDSDGDAAWEDAREGDGEEDGEEDSEASPSNLCLFCKQDEEHDPGDEYEELLTCAGCGETSHRYCAREAGHNPDVTDDSKWRCPDCIPSPIEGSNVGENLESRSPHPHADAPRTDLHGSEQIDGSRSLRKRKMSPVDHDGMSMSLRKRTRKSSHDPAPSVEPTDLNSDAADEDQPRKLRLKVSRRKAVVTIATGPQSMVVKLHVNPTRLKDILPQRASNNRKRGSRPEATRPPRAGLGTMSTPFASSAVQPFYSFLDREMDESKAKPYGGILNDAEADTSKTLPASEDRKRFDEAKQEAEAEWKMLHASESAAEKTEHRKKTRKTNGPASQIECIEFGGWEIDTWYAAPYPEEYSRNRILYICEFCLKYMNSDYVAWRHKLKCPAKHPPGDEIYRHGSVSVFEVDGRKNPVYCQNLCLLAKLFLGSKTLYYDVEPFLFYVLCEYDDLGYHFVGYFSKEKRASSQNNVSCILTLPIHQRKGYGNLLIDFSYLLTRVEQKTGSPEKPLSDMGLVSYRNYWRLVMCQYLLGEWQHALEDDAASGLSVRRISDATGLTPDDVISALEGLRCLARDPVTGLYAFRVDLAYCREYLSKWEAKGYVGLNPAALTWTPYVMGRGNATNFELGPAITAIAPREEDEDHKAKVLPGPGLGAVATDSRDRSDQTRDLDSEATRLGEPAANDAFPGARGGVEEMPQLVRQSTEPNDTLTEGIGEVDGHIDEREGQLDGATVHNKWLSQYEEIAPSRFEVYPAFAGRRAERPRNPGPRPSVLRTGSNSARPRRSAGGSSAVNRPTPSRPKASSSSRRKTGGTGRGPGRWPKGTKKSDYGNASSGPGLPPGWIKERERLLSLKTQDNGEVGTSADRLLDAMDTVRVQFDNQGGVDGLMQDVSLTNGGIGVP